MPPLKAHVRNRRLVLDEPTDLPEGTTVYLRSADDEELDEDERGEQYELLRESIGQMKSG